MVNAAALILIALIIFLTDCTLAFGLLVQQVAHTARGMACVIAGIALGVAMLVATAWNAGHMAPPPASAGAALMLVACTDVTIQWQRRAGSRQAMIAPLRLSRPVARPARRFHLRRAGPFLPAP